MQLNNELIKGQRGVGMIEVVVALFILAVGLLGVLAMQANGIKGNQRAEFSTEVYLLAQDMADRIMAYDDINSPDDDDDYDNLTVNSGSIPAKPNCAAGCAATAQRNLDMNEWGTQLAQRLPGGQGKIDYDDTDAANKKYVVTVMWDANMTGATDDDCGGASNDLTCYSLEFKL